MASYLTIPEITESEALLSVSPQPDGVTFTVVIAVGDVAMRLMRASAQSEHLPLVVLAVDPQMLALDSVYVTNAVTSTAEGDPLVEITFHAEAVRFV